MSYRSALLFKVVSLLVAGFILIAAILWLYFRNEVRNIGYYLRFGRRDDAAQLIADYLGDPPSRLKARMLVHSFSMTILYREGNRIIWVAERQSSPPFTHPEFPELTPPSGRGMMGRGWNMQRMEDMMGRMFRMDFLLAGNRSLTVFLPMRIPPNQPRPLLYIFLFIGILVALVLFFAVRKTLRPLDMIIEAAERIREGDLQYRIRYRKEDDFGKVASAFNAMTEKLSRMLANQRELLHLVSHELRTPLTRINIALELKDKQRGEEIIKNEVKDIDDLVERVLELSRLDYEGQEGEERVIDIMKVLRGVIGSFDQKKIKFNTNLTCAMVGAKGVLVEKAFRNLIDNALRYSRGDTPVEIDIHDDSNGYTISFKNSGTGIAPEELERIWEPFYRGSNSRLAGDEGKGLGLVIVKRAVELSSGKVSVESSPEGPTIFRVWLPAPGVHFTDKGSGLDKVGYG